VAVEPHTVSVHEWVVHASSVPQSEATVHIVVVVGVEVGVVEVDGQPYGQMVVGGIVDDVMVVVVEQPVQS